MWEDLIHIFYPRICCGCDAPLTRNEKIICTSCMISLPKIDPVSFSENEISQRFWGKFSVTYALSYLYFHKSGITQKLLHQLKYSERKDIGIMFGNWLGGEMMYADLAKNFDAIVPVPLHERRLRKRGYNQSEVFSTGISEVTGIPVESNILRRCNFNESQTNKTREERWKNVENAFNITSDLLKGKHVLLVDDVITTGCTIEACGQVLLSSGVRAVSIASIALAK